MCATVCVVPGQSSPEELVSQHRGSGLLALFRCSPGRDHNVFSERTTAAKCI